jgi:K+-transporting ATPase KdpF subunit
MEAVKVLPAAVKKASTGADGHATALSVLMVLARKGLMNAVANELLRNPHADADIHPADGGDVRRLRRGREVGRKTVNYDNVVGLVLAVLLALFLFAALLFPERF